MLAKGRIIVAHALRVRSVTPDASPDAFECVDVVGICPAPQFAF